LQPFTASIAHTAVQNRGVKATNLHIMDDHQRFPDHQTNVRKGKSAADLQQMTAMIA